MKEDIKVCNIRKFGYIILNVALFGIMACVMSTIVFSIFAMSSIEWSFTLQLLTALLLTGMIYPLGLSKRIYTYTVDPSFEG